MRESLGVSHLHAMQCLRWLGRAAIPRWASRTIRRGRSSNRLAFLFFIYLGPFFDGPFLYASVGSRNFTPNLRSGALPIPPKDQKQKNASNHTDKTTHAHEPRYILRAPVHLYYVSSNAF